MSAKSGKRTIRDFFTSKLDKSKKEEIVVNGVDEEVESEEETVVIALEEQKVPSKSPSPKKLVPEPENDNAPTRRSTRVSATRARLALSYVETGSSSDDDFIKENRKRRRKSERGKGKQATISLNGTLVKQVREEVEVEKVSTRKKKKRKIEHDPEREAFLKSDVPEVIKRAKAKNDKKKVIESDEEDDDDEEEDDDIIVEKVKEKRRTLDPETLAFLHSGIPSSMVKVRQKVEEKKEHDEYLTTMGFFPKTSHVCSKVTRITENDKLPAKPLPFSVLSRNNVSSEDCGVVDHSTFLFSNSSTEQDKIADFKCLSSQESFESPVDLCCDESPVTLNSSQCPTKTLGCASCANESENQHEHLPWIDLMKVTCAKKLVVDQNALERLKQWLKQWKNDIKDDGGTSRKIEKKRKRGGNASDSDFVTSEDGESDMKKKSVLLTGPNGCGKTTAVYVLAKKYEFEVVEVNFSSRRSGKDVMQRVEEAVLSHRLKATKNCLLLFKDIDLLDQEEDEGFFAAVAQLITTAVRPIVMTSSLPHYFLIDSKLDKKDPLRIPFSLPKPDEIADKILKPILSSTNHQIHSKSALQLDKWLDSIVRHSGCDIRQCINQLQLLLSAPSNSTCLSNEAIHLYSSPFQRHLIDLNFPRQSTGEGDSGSQSQESNTDNDDLDLSVPARKKRCFRQLQSLVSNLEIFSDLDWISRISPSFPTRNVNVFGDVDEALWHWNHVSGMRSPFFTRLAAQMDENKKENSVTSMRSIRELVLESDKEIDRCIEIDELSDEIGQYLDVGLSSMGSNWEACAAVRTIVKNNMMDSVAGRNQKRGGRMASYFNRIDKSLRDRIVDTFGFKSFLDSAKLSS